MGETERLDEGTDMSPGETHMEGTWKSLFENNNTVYIRFLSPWHPPKDGGWQTCEIAVLRYAISSSMRHVSRQKRNTGGDETFVEFETYSIVLHWG